MGFQSIFPGDGTYQVNTLKAYISGPGGSASFDSGIFPTGSWIRVDAGIDESLWTVDSGDWTAILSDVTELRLLIEPVTTISGDGERSGIDNVTLSPVATPADEDLDGIEDSEDNCPSVPNADQINTDGENDGGDACDDDDDNDGWEDYYDNCPLVINDDQSDGNEDGIGDACDWDNDGVRSDLDNCPLTPNPDQADLDGSGRGDVCDDLPPGC